MTNPPEKLEAMDLLIRLESSVTAVSKQLGALATVVEKNDSDRKAEIRELWEGLKEQAKETTALFRDARGKGEITLGKVIGFCLFLITLAGGIVAVNNAYLSRWFDSISGRFDGVELHRVYSERDRDQIRIDLHREVTAVDHESELRHRAQQIALNTNSASIGSQEVRIRELEIDTARRSGMNEVRFEWLRDDDEAQKEDLQNHIEDSKQQPIP